MEDKHLLHRLQRFDLPEEAVRKFVLAQTLANTYEVQLKRAKDRHDLSDEIKLHIAAQYSYYFTCAAEYKAEFCRRYELPACRCGVDDANNQLIYTGGQMKC